MERKPGLLALHLRPAKTDEFNDALREEESSADFLLYPVHSIALDIQKRVNKHHFRATNIKKKIRMPSWCLKAQTFNALGLLCLEKLLSNNAHRMQLLLC